jgi:hypothetical protein
MYNYVSDFTIKVGGAPEVIPRSNTWGIIDKNRKKKKKVRLG